MLPNGGLTVACELYVLFYALWGARPDSASSKYQ